MKLKNIISFLLISSVFAQISRTDLDRLSNNQLDLIRTEIQKSGRDSNNPEIKKLNTELSKVSINPSKSSTSGNFGYNYFKKSINFFDNIPTPEDFRLGPGDEIILSLWGETNSREKFVINKEGLIYYQNIGFINLSNKTLDEAESILLNELESIYSTLENDNTKLMIELGKIKSINVFFTGQIENPGINLIHPFSDVFSAIVQAGGINSDGSLRNVQIIRKDKILASIDFYSFFISGTNNFSSIRLIEGDIIHVPLVQSRVKLSGEFIKNGFYEVMSGESISDVVKYAGGFTNKASTSAILDIIVPQADRKNDDFARQSKKISTNNFNNLSFNNGDELFLLPIYNVESKVQVLGRVKNPGFFPASSNLKDVLNLAGGFQDPTFRKTIIEDEIVVIRKNEDQFYSEEIKTSYKSSDKIELMPEDMILVYENPNYRTAMNYTIKGEVNKPGPYGLKRGATIKDAIEKAGGFTPIANEKAIFISSEFENQPSNLKRDFLSNVNLDTQISDNSVITVMPYSTLFQVDGNVYQPGLFSMDKSNITFSKAIELAGGFKERSLRRKMYVIGSNGQIDKIGNPLARSVKRVSPGDRIFVPRKEEVDFDVSAFVADLATTLANIAAIILVVENSKDN